jgi:anti-sigma regulatory factor (Ser/Thr protein kinase)
MVHAQRCTRLFAAEMGFYEQACQELAIVASELSSNILKYGTRGYLELSVTESGQEKGLMLSARDWGPPFHNLEMAIMDGYDGRGPIDPDDLLKRGGLGAGLGAVVRLTNSFFVEPDDGGKRVVAIRYLGRPVPRWPAVGPGRRG